MSKRHPTRVFISHSHADNDFGVRLAADLRRELGDEQSVWYDVSGGLHGGDAWWSKIVREIAARPIFVVVLSPDAMDSRWVNDEIDLAWNLKNTPEGKTIIPVLYRECKPRADLMTRHIISFLEPRAYEQALAETLVALGVHERPAAPPSVAPTPATALASPARSAPDIAGQFTPQIEAAYARHDWPDVVRKAEFLTRRAPEHVTAPVYRMLGVALLEDGAPTRAREALDAALALDPLDLDALRAAARAAVALGEPQLAHTLLGDALALASDDALRLRLLADDAYTLRLVGAAAEEVRSCDEALRLARDDLGWRARRVVALTLAGRMADAQAEMEHIARDAASAAHLQGDSRALRIELAREARSFGEARSVAERRVAAERFGALLIRNAAKTPLHDDPLSPQRLDAPRLPERLATLGYILRPFGEVEAILPPLCEVAGGPCLLSEGAGWSPDIRARDLPHQWITVAEFRIARYPVTVAEYACFARAERREPQRWESGGKRLDWQTQLARPDHPVVCVTWHDALAYAAWLTALTGQRWRLPTEAEWEKAARWEPQERKALAYPWGDDFDAARCNCATAIGQTSAVGAYPAGASPCGAADMAGNVWEWTSNLAADDASEARADAEPLEIAMLRGGSWFSA
ncbi:MAG: SUMF1/EgtB/PvdO family nonheme iron enzyme, partial [Chloroflexota bacterium]|nr:SUMF1/EgtB/PvdO family nonheme iron enzyme [Chloroflexota bacterium]